MLAAAALAGVELEHDESFSMSSNWKTPEVLEKTPLGYLPLLEDGDFCLFESGAIAEYGELSLMRCRVLVVRPSEANRVVQFLRDETLLTQLSLS